MIGDRESGLGAGESRPRVIVAGFGPIGRRTTERLIVAGYAVTVIELNPVTVRDESRQGRSIVYGDAASEEVLRSAGIEGAAAMVLTIPDEQAVARACAAAKHLSPGVMVVARTASTGRARAVAALGADHVISEEEATAEAMERLVCERLPKGNDLGGHPAAG